jgi:hypothetical protein
MAEKALTHAYFSDVSGKVVIDFQFSPASLTFVENSKVVEETVVGHYGNDLLWIGGNVSDIKLHIFLDRTEESLVGQKSDALNRTIKTPNVFVAPFQSSVILEAIKNVLGMSSRPGINDPERSSYDPAPHFAQNPNNTTGVLGDVAKFQYFMRPEGYKNSVIIVEGGANKSSKDEDTLTNPNDALFSMPPLIRFYHGEIWVEGYLSVFNYKLTVMDKQLIPNRLEADINIKVHRFGTFRTVTFVREDFESNVKKI